MALVMIGRSVSFHAYIQDLLRNTNLYLGRLEKDEYKCLMLHDNLMKSSEKEPT